MRVTSPTAATRVSSPRRSHATIPTITTIHANGPASTNDIAENTMMPAMLPRMSSRYASSGVNAEKSLPTRSAMAAITATTPRKITDTESHSGNAGIEPSPSNWGARSTAGPIFTGNTSRNTINPTSRSGTHARWSRSPCARRNPTPIPRKLASKTRFVKNER